MGHLAQSDGQSGSLIRSWKAFWGSLVPYTYASIVFWFLFAFCILVEPLLINRRPDGIVFELQYGFISANCCLFIVMLFSMAEAGPEYTNAYTLEVVTSDDKLKIIPRNNREEHEGYPQRILDYYDSKEAPNICMYILRIFARFLSKLEFVIDFACLAVGLFSFKTNPGISALRCFRVLRILWLHKVPVVIDSFSRLAHFIEPVMRSAPVLRVRAFKVMLFSELSFKAMTAELFFLTKDSRGGFLLIATLFYTTYVLGAVFWLEHPNGPESDGITCQSISHCQYTMLRLTFFDGTGLDYAYSLAPNHKGLFFIVMMYL